MDATGADVSVLFVPPAFTKAAVIEAIDAGIGLAVVITEGVAVKDTAEFYNYSLGKGTRIIGPNCPGLISPARKVQRGHHPGQHHRPRKDRAGLEVGHVDLPDDV